MAVLNNKENVSTTRGVKGGYFFSAAIGTAGAPTKSTYKTWAQNIPTGWENQGYIPEDGFTEAVSMESGDAIRDINLDTVDQADGTTDETVTVAFMEMAKAALSTQYGHSNVTDEGGTLEVRHNWGDAGEHRQYVFLLLLKNDRIWVKYIPDGKVTSLGDLTANKTTVAQREATITYNSDADGVGCYDWIESNETEAPKLATLALTGATLAPAFDADVRAYTAADATADITVTATSAGVGTVAIECGGTTYTSGDTVALVTGENVVTVRVTDATGSAGVYTITVTKS
jgi:hypothetical protein